MKAKFKIVWAMAAVALVLGSVHEATAEEVAKEIEAPVEMLKRTSDEVIKLLRDQKDAIKSEPKRIYKIVDEHIVPHLDEVSMAKLALGKNWRKANNEQKIVFVDEFRTLLIRTYSKSLQEFSDETINFFPSDAEAGAKKVIVKSEVIRSGGPKIPVSYRMRLKDKEWKVYDINIDGVSLVTSYRGTFAQEVRKGGMKGLIEMLKDKNSRVVVEDVPTDNSPDQAAAS